MPKITLNTKYFTSLIGSDVPLDKLSDHIYKMGYEVDEIDAKEIKIDVTPNRPDLLGAVGMARALRYFIHKQKNFAYKIKNGDSGITINVDLSVKKVRPFISGFVARNVTLNESSIADMFNFMEKFCDNFGRQRRKVAIGTYDISEIKGPLKYMVAKDEKMLPLNEKKESLYSDVLKRTDKGMKYGSIIKKGGYPVLKDAKGTLALIPIINSDRSKVTTKTKSLLVEITGTSQYLTEKAIDMMACMFIDMGAKVETVTIKYPERDPEQHPKMEPREITVALSKLENEIGVKIGFNNILSLANKMGYDAVLIDKKIRFMVPQYRLDIINEQDIIEDIAIAYGYDYIAAVPVPSINPGSLEKTDALFEKLSEAMIGLGFSESMNSYLTNDEDNFTKMRAEVDVHEAVRVKDARSSNISIMRTWLLSSLLKDLALSKHEKMPQRLFELDMAFSVEKGKVNEWHNLAGVSVDPKSNFNYVKSVVFSVFSLIGKEFKVQPDSAHTFIDGRCASIVVNGKKIGLFGELHPEVLSNFGIEEPAVAFEFCVDML